MNILLINHNPVVSRLLVLCTRDEDMELEEVENMEAIQRKTYDVVFVDEDAYKEDVLLLNQHLSAKTKVLLSKEDIQIRLFDVTIQKPFLPSQIIDVLKATKKEEEHSSFIFPLSSESTDKTATDTENTNVLDIDEIEKIKSLLDEDNTIPVTPIEMLSEEEIEIRKMNAIKEQLISEGLEIVDESDIVKEIGVEDEVISMLESNSTKSKKKKKRNRGKKIKFTRKEREKIEDAVFVAVASLKKKQLKRLLKGKKVQIKIALEGSKLYE